MAHVLVHRDGQGTPTHGDGAQHGIAAGIDHAHAVAQRIGDKDVAAALIHRERMGPPANGNGPHETPAAGVQHVHAVRGQGRDAGGDKDAPRFGGDGQRVRVGDDPGRGQDSAAAGV